MNPYESINLSKVINAAGKMTYLGSSSISPQAAEVMFEAGKSYVDMAALKRNVNDRIAELTGAEGGCITSCAAAGIAISVAACLTGNDLDKVEALPVIKSPHHEVIIQKGHSVNFGANVTQMIRMTGAVVKEIGTVNGVKPYHLEGEINDKTAAIVYVISHHAVSDEMLTLSEVTEIAAKHQVPVIVDAAAEVDLHSYYQQGASLVIYSGHKAIGGPTSGMIIGDKNLIEACQLQEKGYARAMKIGKESIMGFYIALREYVNTDWDEVEGNYVSIVEGLQAGIGELSGLMTKIVWDATRPIPRLQLKLAVDCSLNAKQLIRLMEDNNPSIRTRNHSADQGIILFDPRELKDEEIPTIAQLLRSIII